MMVFIRRFCELARILLRGCLRKYPTYALNKVNLTRNEKTLGTCLQLRPVVVTRIRSAMIASFFCLTDFIVGQKYYYLRSGLLSKEPCTEQ